MAKPDHLTPHPASPSLYLSPGEGEYSLPSPSEREGFGEGCATFSPGEKGRGEGEK